MSTPEQGSGSPPAGKPDPKDGAEEIENAFELVGDLVTGRRTPRDVVVELLEKVFPSKKTEKKPEDAKPDLRAIEGGAGK